MSKLASNQFLFDVATRQQILVERVALWFMEWSNTQYSQLQRKIKNAINDTDYQTLDGLTKLKLNALILKLRKIQNTHFDNYNAQLIKLLISFSNTHLKLSRRVYATAFSFTLGDDEQPKLDDDNDAVSFLEENDKGNSIYPLPLILSNNVGNSDDGFFKKLIAVVAGATGLTIMQMLGNLRTASISNLESAIRASWANRQTIADLVATVAGPKSTQTGNNTIVKNANGAKGVINTIVKQLADQITTSVQSVVYNKYVWVAILDGRTSALCRSLNGQIFVFGKGPLPPAHMNCRSHIVAIGNSDDNGMSDEDFAEWVARQPNTVKRMLAKGTGKGYFPASSLDIDDYGDSDNIILSQ